MTSASQSRCAVVAIGRNEGARLVRCFESIPAGIPAVYVDSGSTDASVAEAQTRGIRVVALDTSQGFTAARARNAGWRDIVSAFPNLAFIQFVDGDCEFAPGWIETAIAALEKEPELASVFGRRRERFPEASRYNALCDDEWNVPVGIVETCGGDALFRRAALEKAGGYNDALIAGEEPDLCLRLGRDGWKVRRIGAEMTLHDAAIFGAGQWWRRMKRGGHAFAEHVALHGDAAFASWRRALAGILRWALYLPLAVVLLLVAALLVRSPWPACAALVLLLAYPANIARLTLRQWRGGAPFSLALFDGYWLIAGKFAQMAGVFQYWRNRLAKRRSSLIEYKGATR